MTKDGLTEYKKTLEQIEVPIGLKAETIARMKAQKPKKKLNPVPYAAAVLAIVVLGGAYLYLGKNGGNEIMLAQTLDAKKVFTEVALSEGSLYFEKIPGQFESTGLQLGVLNEETVLVDEEAYFEYLGTKQLPDEILKGMTKQESEEQNLTKDADGNYTSDCFTITYADDKEKSLEIILSKLGIPDEQECKELTESKIGEASVKISYYGKEDAPVFTAYFMENGIGYKIKGKGVTQEEFVTVILELLRKE